MLQYLLEYKYSVKIMGQVRAFKKRMSASKESCQERPVYDEGQSIAGSTRILWLHVIKQALEDIISPANCAYQEKDKLRKDAALWIFMPNDDFESTCDMAGVTPQKVRVQALHTIKNANPPVSGFFNL